MIRIRNFYSIKICEIFFRRSCASFRCSTMLVIPFTALFLAIFIKIISGSSIFLSFVSFYYLLRPILQSLSLQYRNSVNRESAGRVNSQRELLSVKSQELARLDRRIAELQTRLHRKKMLNHQLAQQITKATQVLFIAYSRANVFLQMTLKFLKNTLFFK